MAKFTDCKKREWHLTLTNGDLRIIRERTGVELGKITFDQPKLAEFFNDSEQVGKVLWTLCEEQARSAGVDSLSFDKGFDGNANRDAAVALYDAMLDFSPWSKTAQTIKGALSRAMEAADNEMAGKVREAMDQSPETLSKSSAALPESSASTPGP